MNAYLTLGMAGLFLALVLAALATLWFRRRGDQRSRSLHQLLELADRLEADLKTCRAGLQQAHAVMSLNPDLPAASEQEARHAIEAGLRSLLQQRIWIRDEAPRASQQQLNRAVSTMTETRGRLAPLLKALEQAQHALDDAMREHIIQRGPEA
ncbi:hypothetical protein [Dyella subtropica]|uniref:hypothetical protein n=1 Tax=Dyella subtropica TaxID=2992127 RepID=UPI00224C927E|nr:hypothetical protein [Dyella subtropica]